MTEPDVKFTLCPTVLKATFQIMLGNWLNNRANRVQRPDIASGDIKYFYRFM
jgi:hypothetical protein